MNITVVREDGRQEVLNLSEGDWTATCGPILNRLSKDGFDHYFTKEGLYDGWGGQVPQGTTFEQAEELIKAVEEKRRISNVND